MTHRIVGRTIVIWEFLTLTWHQEIHNTVSQPFQFNRKSFTISPSPKFAEEVSDTEGDADDESVGSDEKVEVEKPFACQAENCDFSHRSEWGIKKHYMVNRLFLL